MTKRRIPPRIVRIEELAYNLWWSWNEEARALFEALDATLWNDTEHNPVKLLREVPEERLLNAAADPAFLKRSDTVLLAFDELLAGEGSWLTHARPEHGANPIASFPAELGLHNSPTIYSRSLPTR